MLQSFRKIGGGCLSVSEAGACVLTCWIGVNRWWCVGLRRPVIDLDADWRACGGQPFWKGNGGVCKIVACNGRDLERIRDPDRQSLQREKRFVCEWDRPQCHSHSTQQGCQAQGSARRNSCYHFWWWNLLLLPCLNTFTPLRPWTCWRGNPRQQRLQQGRADISSNALLQQVVTLDWFAPTGSTCPSWSASSWKPDSGWCGHCDPSVFVEFISSKENQITRFNIWVASMMVSISLTKWLWDSLLVEQFQDLKEEKCHANLKVKLQSLKASCGIESI